MTLANQRSLFEIPDEIAYLNCSYMSPLPKASRIAGQEGVAIIPSASYGVATAAANIPVAPGQTIVLLEDQFPSNVYPWRELAVRTGATIITVARPADFDWTAALLAQIDERTAVVAVPNCHWTDGSLIDLPRVGERAHAVGAALVVDGAQSVGAHPLSVADVQPDFLVVVTYKWLLGPYSLGFLYVALASSPSPATAR